VKRKIHILGSGNAAKRHREAIERLPALYTIVNYDKADIVDCCGIPYKNKHNALVALRNGKDAILEKPFARDWNSLRNLVVAEEHYGRRVYPVLNYRWRGNPWHAQCMRWNRPASYYEGEHDWRSRKETAFGGVLTSHGLHFIDRKIIDHGPVGAVFCETETDPDYICEVETFASVVLGFASGYTTRISFEITPRKETYAPPNPGWDHFFEDLDSAPRLKELYHLQAVIDACYQSAAQERWITVS
jgi:predicted dehydrogenase